MQQSKTILSKICKDTWNFIKMCGRGINNSYTFCTDWRYRHEVIEEYWNWKTKSVVAIAIPVIIFCSLMSIERDVKAVQVKDKVTGKIETAIKGRTTWSMWYDCVMEELDVGRDTKFSFVTGSCVIDSGRKDESGNVIWSKVDRDVAAGEFSNG